jgi:hypothetical protein
MAGMQLADDVLVHQVHPAEIGADVTTSMVSNVRLWKAIRRLPQRCVFCSLWPAQPLCSPPRWRGCHCGRLVAFGVPENFGPSVTARS